ncbi:MAG: hypothetical protein E7632_12485, partial [Ruminococcaceae bacterium]|nr:hypothetical protein [Oscillospiraceae bacterium]
MKKFLAILLAALMAFTMAACGGAASDDTDAAGNDAASAQNHATCTVTLDSGAVIVIGGAANDTVSKLGDHIDYMEAPSCVHEGSDKVYTYDGYTVTTSPDAAGNEYVAELALTSDVVALDNGVYIGCTLDEVKAAFGDSFEESFGVCKFTLDG